VPQIANGYQATLTPPASPHNLDPKTYFLAEILKIFIVHGVVVNINLFLIVKEPMIF